MKEKGNYVVVFYFFLQYKNNDSCKCNPGEYKKKDFQPRGFIRRGDLVATCRDRDADKERECNDRRYRFAVHRDSPVRMVGLFQYHHALSTTIRYADSGREDHISVVGLISDVHAL